MIHSDELECAIEAIIFASPKPISAEKIASFFDGLTARDLIPLIRNLQSHYANSQRGIEIVDVAGGFQFRTKPSHSEFAKRMFAAAKKSFLTQSQLECLSIIAYRQPVTKAEIDAIRGVDSSSQVKVLSEKKLIKIIGKKDVVGKPFVYGTTKEFLEIFSIKNLAMLPKIEIEGTNEEKPKEIQYFLPEGEAGENPEDNIQ